MMLAGGSKKSGIYAKTNTEEHPHPHDEDGHGDEGTQNVVEPFEVSVDDGTQFARGELQEPAFRDKWFGLIFMIHLCVMISVGIMYATGTLEIIEVDGEESGGGHNRRRHLLMNRILQSSQSDEYYLQEDEDEVPSVSKVLAWSVLILVVPSVVSIAMLTLMKRNAVKLIQFSLYFSIGLNAALALTLLLTGGDDGFGSAILPMLFVLILICYTKAVWHRIPYAASNLKTAISVVESNLGMVALTVANIPIVTSWIMLWLYTGSCVLKSPWFTAQETMESNGQEQVVESITPQGFMAIIGLLLSFYWTIQVLNNVVHTTLAGTVGTWWFIPQEASSCCSRGLTDSLCRSLSYSFGSICLGSLIVAIIETLRSIFRSQARNRRGGIVALLAQCLLHFIERIAKYFNKWAFVYVGLYGYSYVDAGKNVLNLFNHRGWSAIISDSLIMRMLLMMSFCIGIVTAVIVSLITWTFDAGVIFGTFFLGFIMSNLVFRVLVSAVDSVIVLFAEAPREFQENHPELSREMTSSWSQAWPDIFSPAGTVEVAGGSSATIATATIVSSNNYSDHGSNHDDLPKAAEVIPATSLV